MVEINFKNVSVDIPVYNVHGRSLKSSLIRAATGTRLSADNHGRVIVRAIDNISFSLKRGERLGLLGHNGAGKSTLLRLLSGAYIPTSGSRLVEGSVGALIDISLGIDDESTGRENIIMRGALLGLKYREIIEIMDDIIFISDLGEFIDMPVRTYSTGMKMRLSFAVSTATRPQILLMDEWLSVGDESFKKQAESRLAEVIKSSEILIIASHSKNLILKNCNRVFWLENGRVKMDGDPEKVCSAYFGRGK